MTTEVRFHVSVKVRAKAAQVAKITREPPKAVYAAWLSSMVDQLDDETLTEIVLKYWAPIHPEAQAMLEAMAGQEGS